MGTRHLYWIFTGPSFAEYKEIQVGEVAKSCRRKGFLIYEEMRKYLVIYEEAAHWISLYMRKILFSFLSVWVEHMEVIFSILPFQLTHLAPHPFLSTF
jgi:hypothetical protein